MKEQLITLYQSGKLDAGGILNAVSNGFITLDEAVEIVGEENAASLIKSAKIAELSAACNTAIVSGIDLELGEDTAHFNLSIEDQSNIANLFRVVELGGSQFPYQADGGVCRIYTAQEIVKIYIAAQTLITYQTTYHNALKAYVLTLDSVEDIAAVEYGMELPAEYAAEVAAKLGVAQAQMDAIVARLSAAEG